MEERVESVSNGVGVDTHFLEALTGVFFRLFGAVGAVKGGFESAGNAASRGSTSVFRLLEEAKKKRNGRTTHRWSCTILACSTSSSFVSA